MSPVVDKAPMMPIKFNSEMVDAILEGRKTQTRRLARAGYFTRTDENPSPYGNEGARLWVQEPCDMGFDFRGDCIMAAYTRKGFRMSSKTMAPDAPSGSEAWCLHWIELPPKEMPRWASRIELEITNVRLEPLKNIGIYDVRAEGLDLSGIIEGFETESDRVEGDDPDGYVQIAKKMFGRYWNTLYERSSCRWEANPYVWVYDFKVVK